MKELSKYQTVFSRAPKKAKVIPEIQKEEKPAKKKYKKSKEAQTENYTRKLMNRRNTNVGLIKSGQRKTEISRP